MNYRFFIDQISKIIKIYSELINLAEDCDLDEDDFLDAMKVVQKINKDIKTEYNKQSFKVLNIKYIEGLREAKDINCL